ncbi:DNA glycosylase [Lactarius akahatsu]|uniref:DNA glycosylase n=1 Tax=Lactarius akahatsu TaxID=416441 RepID=A0AAD4Q7M4_9AGAM|nr:DNA glycosylase [Lactarius akahatsu]
MPVTRSATRASAAASAARSLPVADAKRPPKRQESVVTKRPKKATKVGADEGVPRPLIPPSGEELAPLPAKLTFSLEDAKNHLIQADYRFEDVLSRLPCTPFESVEAIHPFQTLCYSILGQQISWLAARAIHHKFLRLYFPELPEKPDEQYWAKSRQEVFPTAYQVATTDLAILRTAGLSGRKAEYVRDLATRFADGRLTNQKLLDANDEELFELLTAVYGIGKWTVEMFAIFSLRRPDILPVGDLGVQRGLLRWVLSLHQPEYRIEVSPKKLPDSSEDPPKAEGSAKPKSTPAKSKKLKNKPTSVKMKPDQESEPPTLNGRLRRAPIPPLPAGLTIDYLTDRLKGKNKVKGPILTPTQMEELTESWRPYRSIGVYYMWALAEEKAGS